MIPKIIVVICLVLFIFTGKAQVADSCFFGKILDKNTLKPVPGTYIYMKGDPVSFTDENGVFNYNSQLEDSCVVTIKHIAYKPVSFTQGELTRDTSIFLLEEKHLNIFEITVVAEKLRSLIKKAHLQFKKKYHPFSYWGKSGFIQVINYQGECKSYIECHGYTFVPEVDKMVWRGEPSIVPVHIRRNIESPDLQTFCYSKLNRLTLQVAPDYSKVSCGEYAFFERIHPLGKFNFKDYVFRLDTADTGKKNYILLYKTKKSGFGVVGWWTHGVRGKIWIDRKTLEIRKIIGTFNRNRYVFNEIEVDYTTIDGVIYPKKIHWKNIFNENKDEIKNKEKLLVEGNLDFSVINTTPRTNYMLPRNWISYRMGTIVTDYKYVPSYWSKFPVDTNMCICFKGLTNSEINKEFFVGAKEPVYDKTCWQYKYYIGEYRETSRQFIQQMKKDLNLTQ